MEIDGLRTIAIVLMVIYHSAYDLWAFYDWNIDPFHGWLMILGRTSAVLFLSLVGISFALSSKRHRVETFDSHVSLSTYNRSLKRGLTILGWGMAITIVTYIFDPTTYVRFGILHLIGVSILLLPFFARLREWNGMIGIAVIVIGRCINRLNAPTSLLLPIGIPPHHFTTIDYYPLLPWFGMILIGYAVGYFMYIRHGDKRQATNEKRWYTLPGRHSLMVYLFHQPIIMVVLKLMFGR